MGPRKDSKREDVNERSIEDPINSDTWKCAVVMAVERTYTDNFVLKCFAEEAAIGRRNNVKLINFDPFVIKILNDFANGELSFKHAFLLNFSTIFQEAAEWMKYKSDIPSQLLAKVVKALLLLLKDESQKRAEDPYDHIQAMAERPVDLSDAAEHKLKINDTQKKVQTNLKKRKRGVSDAEGSLILKPPSTTKQDTKLLKRGEGVKEDQCIDDSPPDTFFDLYVVLTGFYCADLPLELIKADVPLYAILCIDTSQSAVKRVPSSTLTQLSTSKYHKHASDSKCQEIQLFWDSLLTTLWDPRDNFYFKDTILQVYAPQKLLCNKKKLQEFIYKEISYLAYDLSDLKRQLDNYLRHMKLRNVSDIKKIKSNVNLIPEIDYLPSECITIPIIFRFIMDLICGKDKIHSNGSVLSIDSVSTQSENCVTQSLTVKYGSSMVNPAWSQIVGEMENYNYSSVYSKIKQLDTNYSLDECFLLHTLPEKFYFQKESQTSCSITKKEGGDDLPTFEGGIFTSYWRKIKRDSHFKQESIFADVDYCLYSLLVTKVLCPYETSRSEKTSYKKSPCPNKNQNFEIIENFDLKKPHFTVTECSRNILKSIPFNFKETRKDFFSPSQLKIVTPEKLKASSAPEFHSVAKLIPNISFISALSDPNDFFRNFEIDVFENLRKFLGEAAFENVNGFDFVEELSKPKLLAKESQECDNYNCVDYNYSGLVDAVFMMVHNRTREDGTFHETFNAALRTRIGLRDFFDYILEDEADWLKKQEDSKNNLTFSEKKSLEDDEIITYNDSFFWLENSIKYQERKQISLSKDLNGDKNLTDNKKQGSKTAAADKILKKDLVQDSKEAFPGNEDALIEGEDSFEFEGYDISDVVVQFSGLKTRYQVQDCSITVELIERLYGDQTVGIQVQQGGHTLYLYSYACPEPRLDSYAFHIAFANGVFLAFSKRFIETPKVEEKRNSKEIPNNEKKFSSSSIKMKKQEPERLEDKAFSYDMKVSLPNGLVVSVVRRGPTPCYIKQKFFKSGLSSKTVKTEKCRLFLPNGNVVRMLGDETVQVLKVDTSTVTAKLSDFARAATLSKGPEAETKVHFSEEQFKKHEKNEDYDEESNGEGRKLKNYKIVTPTAYSCTVEKDRLTSYRKLKIFHQTDVSSKTAFFRRRDGTNYMLLNDGTLCMQFKDGTKISNSVFVKDDGVFHPSVSESNQLFDEVIDFVLVYREVTVEHPDYATVKYNTYSQTWRIILPCESEITVSPRGNYFVKIDKQTELNVDANFIQMNRFSPSYKLICSMTADLTVFDDLENKRPYCRMQDSKGKTFIVEPNSNCYVKQENHSETDKAVTEEALESSRSTLESSEDFSCDLTTQSTNCITGKRLSRKNKYFVVKRNITGFELHHKDDVNQILTELEKGSVVFTQEIPDLNSLRCFVLISPKPEVKRKKRKWEVESVIPEPKYTRNLAKVETSSTYGDPPSWMHPFPKHKKKFETPKALTCRVFVETKKTDFCPTLGYIESSNCEIDDVIEVEHSKLEPGIKNLREYMKKLANDNQDVLREMYKLVVKKILGGKLQSRPVHSERIEEYLAKSKFFVELQEYHKKSIRHNIVPKFFHHPAGMSWVIINNTVNKLVGLVKEPERKETPRFQRQAEFRSITSESTLEISVEELEYNLTDRSRQTYSEMSFKTDISMITAPAVLRGAFCRCIVKDTRASKSSPDVADLHTGSSDPNFYATPQRVCAFQKEEFDMVAKPRQDELPSLTVEDLMSLGLI